MHPAPSIIIFTVFSGLDHRAGNGHGNWNNFLCGQNPGRYSLDQMVADEIGQDSRFPSIQLSAGKASRTMSHTKQGIALPMTERPSVLFSKLFASPADRAILYCGPEGGFTDHEVAQLRDQGALTLWLGQRTLRSDTAALTGIVLLQQRCGDLGAPAVDPGDWRAPTC